MLHAEASLELTAPREQEYALLLRRVAESAPFRSSARLREFLLYIGDCALRNAPGEATEQQIALHVFKRQPGPSSNEDSIVRTHARLLRQKLALYFADEGRHEPVILEVPKGHYLLVFTPRAESPSIPPGELLVSAPAMRPLPLPAAVESAQPRPARGYAAWALGCVLMVVAGMLILRWRHHHPPPTAVEQFWKPFFTQGPPLVVFSNALFQGDAKRGLSYAQDGQESSEAKAALIDTYTGVGELTAVYTLTQLFDAHQAHFVLKRSQLMTWDDAKVRNVIFIGSTAENPSLKALQSSLDFSIVASPDAAGIVDQRPKAGEPAAYWRPEHPLTRDYAIVALMPGMLPGESILVFSGLTTYGTQAGVEFVCRQDSAAELIRRVAGPKGELRPFEAVIETTITGGVPLQAYLVTVHVH